MDTNNCQKGSFKLNFKYKNRLLHVDNNFNNNNFNNPLLTIVVDFFHCFNVCTGSVKAGQRGQLSLGSQCCNLFVSLPTKVHYNLKCYRKRLV